VGALIDTPAVATAPRRGQESMLLLAPVLLALLVALLRGGSLHNLADLPLRGIPLMLLAVALQIALYLPGLRTVPLVTSHGAVIYGVTLALLVAAALVNWSLGLAVRVAALGVALNALVIVANGGYMPTNGAAMRAVRGARVVRDIANRHLYGNTRLATPQTRLVALSDIIPVPFPPGAGNVYSVGDGLLALGIATLIYQGTRRPCMPRRCGT